MTEKLFKRLQKKGFIDWGVIYLGWLGIIEPPTRFLQKIIDEKATAILGHLQNEDPHFPYIATLTSISSLTEADVTHNIQKLVALDDIDLKLAERKWRLVLLEELLSAMIKHPDPVNDLIELTDFWSSWGDNDDIPLKIQSVDSNLSPTEYYTEKNLQESIKQHKIWLDQEEQTIILATT